MKYTIEKVVRGYLVYRLDSYNLPMTDVHAHSTLDEAIETLRALLENRAASVCPDGIVVIKS